jgi:hypothetical protein
MGPNAFNDLLMLSYVSTALFLSPILLLALAFPYAVLRLRDGRDGPPDPQLGFKAAQHFFFSLGIFLALTGVTIIVVDLIIDLGTPPRPGPQPGFQPFGGPQRPRDDFPNSAQRTGAAMILSGGMFGVIHLVLLLVLTSGPVSSPARRTFLGCRAAVHGLVVMFTLTALLIVFFQRSDGPAEFVLARTRNALIGVLLVWAPSWVVHFSLLRLACVPPSDYVGPRRLFRGPGPDDEDDAGR